MTYVKLEAAERIVRENFVEGPTETIVQLRALAPVVEVPGAIDAILDAANWVPTPEPVSSESLAAARLELAALREKAAERDRMLRVLARLLKQLRNCPYPSTDPIWFMLEREAVYFFPLGDYQRALSAPTEPRS